MPKTDSKAESVQLTFHVERDTKNKMRYQEMLAGPDNNLVPATKDNAVVEKLYVSKRTLKKMGNPATLRVTIEAVQ